MPGSKTGGLKAAETNKKKYGDDFYKRIGAKGGGISRGGGFASQEVGADGLTGQERARIAGAKAGRRSKKGYKFLGEESGKLKYVAKDTGRVVYYKQYDIENKK